MTTPPGACPAATDTSSTETGSTGSSLRMDLPVVAESVPRARESVRRALDLCGIVDPGLRYDVELVASELVTNAIRFGAGHIRLGLTVGAGGLLVVVEDGNALPPVQPLRADPDAEGGLGLSIIAAVADEWGVEELAEGGKRVWARLPATQLLPPVAPGPRTPGA